MDRKALLLIALFFFSGIVSAASVGAVPGNIEISDVNPGSSVEGTFYITTNYDTAFTVDPSASSTTSPTFVLESENPSIVSEQGSGSWFSFEETRVSPNNETSITLSDGTAVNSNARVDYTLDIPNDAEPGLHYGSIELNSDISGDQSEPGTNNFGETNIRYSIMVEGDPLRNIVVQDVRAFRLGEDEAAVEVLLRNEGTVTTSTEDFQVDVLDATGATEATLTAGDAVLEPGEERYVEASWGSEDGIEEGAYQIDGEVDYLTGQATASGSFSLPGFDVVEVRPDDSPAVDGEQDRGGLPLWLVAMILVLLGVLMWSFGIDPFWILLIVGIFGISAFILMSGISNYLLILLLMVVGIVVYGGL